MYYYNDDEIIVVTSERPVIQTVFNVPFESIQELEPGMAVITKKSGDTEIKQILAPQLKRACSFERIYFSRGSDAEIYQERKNLGAALFPMVHKAIEGDLENSVFSFIPNTAETSFYGMIGAVQDHVRDLLTKSIKKDPPRYTNSDSSLRKISLFKKSFHLFKGGNNKVKNLN